MPTSPTHTILSRGNILLVSLIFVGVFTTAGTALLSYLSVYARSGRVAVASTQALAIAEGAIDHAAYTLNQNPLYTGESDTALGAGTFTIAVANIDSTTKRITATGYVPNRTSPIATKTVRVHIGIDGTVVSFHYGVQTGQGGFEMENSSFIRGNVYSSGPVKGSGNNYVYGDVVSSGPSGLVYGIHATSSIYAHTIGKTGETTTADKDAYYTTKISTTVGGTSYPGSPDQPSADLPISDDQITDWETDAAAGGVATCSGGTYTISNAAVTLGPKKIPCDLYITGTSVVTVAGHIWVTGNISVQNSSVVKMSPSLGAQNVAIIADNPADRINSSTIAVKNTASFQNSGTAGSYVFLISQNNSAEMGGNVPAFDLANSASAMVAYAAHGYIPLANTVSLKELTAYKIHLKNSASVVYDTGLPSAVFEAGPGASWGFIPGTYTIIQ